MKGGTLRFTRLKAGIAAVAITVAAVGGAAGVANAHKWGGIGTDPVHTHYSCSKYTTTMNQCERWILANGAVIQGPASLLVQQVNYVLVWCSGTLAGDGRWQFTTVPYGPWGNTGAHPYCKLPTYAGKSWSVTNP
jgi:hypothetical protein